MNKAIAVLCAVLLTAGGIAPRAWAQNGTSSTKTKTSPAKKSVKKTAAPSPARAQEGTKAPVKKSSSPVEGDAAGVEPAEEAADRSSGPEQQEENEVQASTGTAAGAGEFTAALSDMNYKLEIMQERYLKLNQDIEDLRIADRDQRRLFNEQVLRQVDQKKIDSIEAEIALIRSDLAQAREELKLINTEVAGGASRGKGGRKDLDDIIRSPWIAVSALGLSVLAILVRH